MKNKSVWHWLTVVACCGMSISSLGLVFNCIGVFFSPVSSELGVGRGAVALLTTIAILGNGFCAPLFGKLLRRFSLRTILSISVLITGLATMAMSLAGSTWQLYALSAVQGVAVSLFGSVPVTIILTNWFEKKLGLATGISFCFSGVGGAVFSPLFNLLISAQGWRTGFVLLGATILLFALPGALFILRLRPEERSLLPYGAEKPIERPQPSAGPETKVRGVFGLSFVLLSALAVFASFCTGLTQHLPGFAESVGLGAAAGAAMVSAAMLGNLSSKLIIGIISDWLGPIRACLVMVITCMLALTVLIAFPNGALIVMLAAAYLLGAIYSVCTVGMPLVTRQVFGWERYSTVFPRITVIASLGSASALTVVGFIYDFTHSYSAAFLCCMALLLICGALLLILRRRKA